MKKYIPLIFTVFAFIILVAMGTWQVQRLYWKKELMAIIDSRMAQEPMALAEYENPNVDEYRLITLTGTYDHKNEMQIIGRPFNGKPGIHIITPMLTDKGPILINRGWSKYDQPYSRPEGVQTVTGVIRKSQKRNFLSRHMTMDNKPADNLWFYAELAQMYPHIQAPNPGFYIELVTDEKPIKTVLERESYSYPYALPREIKLYNEHLAYAITWYSLSIALLLIYYFRFHRKSRK
jgi:surfeit locus 1 family protein